MNRTLIIWIEDDVVADEVNVSDNIYVDGEVSVGWMPLDLFGDGKIDMKDLAFIGKSVGIVLERNSPENSWLWMCDLDQDRKIDMRDIAVVDPKFQPATLMDRHSE